MQPKPSIGRIVHVVLPDGQHRPAIIVRVNNDAGSVNVRVFYDGSNDHRAREADGRFHSDWVTSISPDYGEHPQPATWHRLELA